MNFSYKSLSAFHGVCLQTRSIFKPFAVPFRSVQSIWHPVASLEAGWCLLPKISTQCLGYAMQGQIHACTAQGCPRVINNVMGSFSGMLPLCHLPVFFGPLGSLLVLLPDSSSLHHPHHSSLPLTTLTPRAKPQGQKRMKNISYRFILLSWDLMFSHQSRGFSLLPQR